MDERTDEMTEDLLGIGITTPNLDLTMHEISAGIRNAGPQRTVKTMPVGRD